MNNKNSGLLVDGMTAQQLIGNELFEFQEATGFDTAAEYRASLSAATAHPAGDAIRDAALEAAAKACEAQGGSMSMFANTSDARIDSGAIKRCAAAIRALRGRAG